MSGKSFPPGPYIIGQPGGPAGPFWSLVNQQGNVVAMQIVSEEAARFLQAAPDVLEALEELLEVQYDGDPLHQAGDPLCQKAKAAIARARGKESYSWQLDEYEDGDDDEPEEGVFKDPVTLGDFDLWDEDELCPRCDGYLRSRECGQLGCDDGWIDMHEYDNPLWFDPGDVEMCLECRGTGVVTWCPNCGWAPGDDEEE